MTAIKKATTQLALVTGYITGLQKSPPAGVKSVNVSGETFTIPALITDLQGIQTLDQAPVDARSKWKTAVAAAKAQAKANRTMLIAVKQALIQAYGSDTEGLAGCGIVVKTPAPRSSQTNAIAAARAAETRKANGTGKKSKTPSASVTVTDASGQVIGQPTTSAPVATGSAPVVSPPAASTAPAAGNASAPATAAAATAAGA